MKNKGNSEVEEAILREAQEMKALLEALTKNAETPTNPIEQVGEQNAASLMEELSPEDYKLETPMDYHNGCVQELAIISQQVNSINTNDLDDKKTKEIARIQSSIQELNVLLGNIKVLIDKNNPNDQTKITELLRFTAQSILKLTLDTFSVQDEIQKEKELKILYEQHPEFSDINETQAEEKSEKNGTISGTKVAEGLNADEQHSVAIEQEAEMQVVGNDILATTQMAKGPSSDEQDLEEQKEQITSEEPKVNELDEFLEQFTQFSQSALDQREQTADQNNTSLVEELASEQYTLETPMDYHNGCIQELAITSQQVNSINPNDLDDKKSKEVIRIQSSIQELNVLLGNIKVLIDKNNPNDQTKITELLGFTAESIVKLTLDTFSVQGEIQKEKELKILYEQYPELADTQESEAEGPNSQEHESDAPEQKENQANLYADSDVNMYDSMVVKDVNTISSPSMQVALDNLDNREPEIQSTKDRAPLPTAQEIQKRILESSTQSTNTPRINSTTIEAQGEAKEQESSKTNQEQVSLGTPLNIRKAQVNLARMAGLTERDDLKEAEREMCKDMNSKGSSASQSVQDTRVNQSESISQSEGKEVNEVQEQENEQKAQGPDTHQTQEAEYGTKVKEFMNHSPDKAIILLNQRKLELQTQFAKTPENTDIARELGQVKQAINIIAERRYEVPRQPTKNDLQQNIAIAQGELNKIINEATSLAKVQKLTGKAPDKAASESLAKQATTLINEIEDAKKVLMGMEANPNPVDPVQPEVGVISKGAEDVIVLDEFEQLDIAIDKLLAQEDVKNNDSTLSESSTNDSPPPIPPFILPEDQSNELESEEFDQTPLPLDQIDQTEIDEFLKAELADIRKPNEHATIPKNDVKVVKEKRSQWVTENNTTKSAQQQTQSTTVATQINASPVSQSTASSNTASQTKSAPSESTEMFNRRMQAVVPKPTVPKANPNNEVQAKQMMNQYMNPAYQNRDTSTPAPLQSKSNGAVASFARMQKKSQASLKATQNNVGTTGLKVTEDKDEQPRMSGKSGS